MLARKPNLFRKKSLERLSSPERLDQLMQVVSPKSWLPLVALGSLAGVAILWSIYGRIPITVQGQGVLIYPSKVLPLQSKSAGQLQTLNIKVGDIVKKGQILATIDQTELQKQLQQQRTKLSELQAQDQAASSLQGQGSTQEKKTLEQQRQNALKRIQELQILAPDFQHKSRESIQKQRLQIQQRITELETLAPTLQQKSRESLQKQRQSLQGQINTAKAQLPVLKSRIEKRQPLLQQGAITQDALLQVEQEYLKKQEEVAQLETQLTELGVKETDIQEKHINTINEISKNRAELQKLELEENNYRETYLKNLNEIAKLRADLKDFDSREANLAKQSLQDSTTRKNQIQEVQREIAKLELQLQNNSQIISQQAGRILELTVTSGQVINAGTRLGTIDAEDSSRKLVGVAYFSVGDGKKIQSGMTIQMTPQTVKRERFGGIVGNVTNVSQFPITKEAAASEVGNADIVASLVSQKQEGLMQVFANLELDPNTPSGYKWSSSTGPQTKISPGTTTVVRVKVEERAPITFILPILREHSGIY
ncbi:MAG: NHLP bacteriocin system secretion protein [Scytonematopsis contorta HA4267-MV1]|jgi:HlyD family secretion protein|nr:NHLP bacteriocin system secretion protein [Scytonematopsis contorta HA4267-MV1]